MEITDAEKRTMSGQGESGRRRRGRCLAGLLGLLALLRAAPATAEIVRCMDMLAPAYQTDWQAGLIPVGPALAGGVFDTGADAVRVRVSSAPGIGDPSKHRFTREISIALSGDGVLSYGDAQAAHPECAAAFSRFEVGSPPSGVDIVAADVRSDAASQCVFLHTLVVPWSVFVSPATGYCGFSRSATVNGMYNLSGRVHVKWSDFDDKNSDYPIYGPNELFYDARIGLTETVSEDTGPVIMNWGPTSTATKTKTQTKTSATNTNTRTQTRTSTTATRTVTSSVTITQTTSSKTTVRWLRCMQRDRNAIPSLARCIERATDCCSFLLPLAGAR